MKQVKDYYRRITESLPQGAYFRDLVFLFLSVLLILSNILVASTIFEYMNSIKLRQEAVNSFNYWRQVTQKHPNSPDAFYEAGFYSELLGNRAEAIKLLDEAITLDPAFEKAKKLRESISGDK